MDAAYADYAARISDLPSVATDCAEEIARFQVWVANSANMIVGGLVLVPWDRFMWLANVAVHPDHRWAGLGRALMELAENEASKQGFRELRLNTHVDMPGNVQLYAYLGWEESGRNGNKISMRKML